MNADVTQRYFYSDGKENFGQLSREEIQKRIAMDPQGRHLIWREDWSEWKQALEIFPAPTVPVIGDLAVGDAIPEPPSNVTGGSNPQTIAGKVNSPGRETGAGQVDASSPEATVTEAGTRNESPRIERELAAPDPTIKSGDTLTRPSARTGKRSGNSLIWYAVGAAALLIVVFVFIYIGSDSEDMFPGVYAVSGGSIDATLRIEAVGDGTYRIDGESYFDTGNELGPNSGEIDLQATLQDDALVAHGEDGYVLRLRSVEGGIEAEEEGSNPYFGMNVSFAFRYQRTTEEDVAERRTAARNASDNESDVRAELFEESQPGGEPQVSLDLGGAEVLGLAGTWWVASTLENDEENYGVANLDDNDATTVWAEGEPGAGEGLRLEFTPHDQDAGQIAGFSILNGHCRTRKLWEANARVRSVRITSGGNQYTVELHDTPNWQYVYLPDCKVDGPIVFEVLSVYPGSKYEDLTISELGIMWELQSDE